RQLLHASGPRPCALRSALISACCVDRTATDGGAVRTGAVPRPDDDDDAGGFDEGFGLGLGAVATWGGSGCPSPNALAGTLAVCCREAASACAASDGRCVAEMVPAPSTATTTRPEIHPKTRMAAESGERPPAFLGNSG